MDSRGVSSAGGPIRKSKATHPSLIDVDHVVADLYDMVNVPTAVWIDDLRIYDAENPVETATTSAATLKARF